MIERGSAWNPLFFALLLAGCTPGESSSPKKDTAKPEVPDVVTYVIEGTVALHMSFGFDELTGQISPVTIGDNEQESTFEVRLGDPLWNGDPENTNDYCTLTWQLDGLVADDFAAADGWWFGLEGLDIERGATDCISQQLRLDLLQVFTDLSWRFSFGGDLDPVVEELVTPSLENPTEIDTLFGGTIEVPDFITGELALYNQGLEIDADRNLIIDALDLPQPLDAGDVPTAAGLATAWYKVGIPWLITMQVDGETTEIDEPSRRRLRLCPSKLHFM